MDRISQIVKLYLEADTNYALLITGDWGSGKTFYYNNILIPLIKEIPVFEDARKKYRPLRISLFGLKSIEEIQAEILLSLYPILKNPKIRIGADITQALIKGVMALKGYGEFYKIIEDVNIKKSKIYEDLNLEELVICFDDLERISDKLGIQEFIGYVNTLIEDRNNKVLIIANQNKIEDDRFKEIKEKVIGNTIEFEVSLSDSFDNILEAKFSGSPTYKIFLQEKKELILNFFSKVSKNLRTLSFALKQFQIIFSEMENNLSEIQILYAAKEQIIKNLLEFSIAISIEYQRGKITYKNDKDLNTSSLRLILKSNSKNEEDKKYNDRFKEKYYDNERYTFYSSVYNYITGGELFNYKTLLEELKSLYNIKTNGIIDPQYELYNKLNYEECYSLGDDEYIKLTNELWMYTKLGMYGLKDYIHLFHFLTRFGNPLNFDIRDLTSKLIDIAKANASKYTYIQDLDFYLDMEVYEKSNDKSFYEQIRKELLLLNDNIKQKDIRDEIKELEELCYLDFDKFLEIIIKKDNPFVYKPVLKDFNPNKFFSLFEEKLYLRLAIIRFIRHRFSIDSHAILAEESSFLKALLFKVEDKLTLNDKNVSGTMYKWFSAELKKAIDFLEKTKSVSDNN